MSQDRDVTADIAAFLHGDRELLDQMRAAVEVVVGSFRSFSAEQRDELVQDSMARLLVSLRQGRFRGDASLRTYAQQVAHYACLEYRRSCKPTVEVDAQALPSQETWSTPEETLIRSEEHRRNLELLASLPTESRELLRLIFEEGLTYREVAMKLGMSEGAIKSRIHRLRLEKRADAAADGRPRRKSGPAPRATVRRVDE